VRRRIRCLFVENDGRILPSYHRDKMSAGQRVVCGMWRGKARIFEDCLDERDGFGGACGRIVWQMAGIMEDLGMFGV
jgi:hypothetical protein